MLLSSTQHGHLCSRLRGWVLLCGFFCSVATPIVAQEARGREEQVRYYINGTVFRSKNQKPIKGAQIFAYEQHTDPTTGETSFVSAFTTTPTSNVSGVFSIQLYAERAYRIEVSAQGYEAQTYLMPAQTVNDGEKISIEIPLHEGYFTQFDGLLLDQHTQQPLPNALIVLTEGEGVHNKQARTDQDGRFSFLVDEEKSYRLRLEKDHYFGKQQTLVLTPEVPVIFQKMTLEKIRQGLQIALDTFFFSVNSPILTENYAAQLAHIERVLHENSSLQLEIGCHSDSRGDDAYNLALSQERAEAIAAYLVERGVAARQLSAKGYGETQLLNECANGVKCSNEQHEKNRRIVFTVLGMLE